MSNNYMSSLLSYSSEVISEDLKAHKDNITKSLFYQELALAIKDLKMKAEVAQVQLPKMVTWMAEMPFCDTMGWNKGTWFDIEPALGHVMEVACHDDHDVKLAAWRVHTLLSMLLYLTYDIK